MSDLSEDRSHYLAVHFRRYDFPWKLNRKIAGTLEYNIQRLFTLCKVIAAANTLIHVYAACGLYVEWTLVRIIDSTAKVVWDIPCTCQIGLGKGYSYDLEQLPQSAKLTHLSHDTPRNDTTINPLD